MQLNAISKKEKKNLSCQQYFALALSRIFPFEERRRREVKPVWLKKPWRGVVTVIYIYSLPRHLGGCYPGGLC